MLYFLTVPLGITAIIMLFTGNLLSALAVLLSLALTIASARATKKGVRAKFDYDSRQIARAPKVPMKLVGSAYLGLAAGIVAVGAAGYGLFSTLGFAGAALAGHVLCYGLDPFKTKGEVAGHGYTPDEVAEAVDAARAKIEAIHNAARSIKVREFHARLTRICDIARNVVDQIEEDPGDLRRARKFLNLYLKSAEQVTEKYSITHQRTNDAELEHNFRTLLVNMENAFEDQYAKLLRNEKFDLDVEIEVLNDQLRREGIV